MCLPPLWVSVPVGALRQRQVQVCMWHLSVFVSPYVSVCPAETMRSGKAPSLDSIPALPAARPKQVP